MGWKSKINLNIVVRNIIILIIVIAIIVLCVSLPNSGEFLPNVNKARYKAEKNADQLKKVYEQEGNKERFLSDIEKVQNAISMALLNKDVVDDITMKARIKEINKELTKSSWEMLGIEVPTFWVGTWSVDSVGTIKFAFLNKESIPSWASDEDVMPHIIVN